MPEGLIPYLPYLLPPLLGALIGYVTNFVAIRMLFRPLRPWRIFGIRLPLTPGVIPARRHLLAEKIGQMVGRHLLTPDDVGLALQKEGFQRELRQALDEKLGQFLSRDLGPPNDLVPRAFQHRFREMTTNLRFKSLRLLRDYLSSETFTMEVDRYLQSKARQWLGNDLSRLLAEEREQDLLLYLEALLHRWQQSDELATSLARFVEGRLEELLSTQRSLRELLPQDLVELILDQLEEEIPGLLDKGATLLHDPEVRQRLIRRARQAIDNFLDSLEGLAGLLSGFVNLDTIYARLPEFLDKAAEELAAWLKEEKTRAQVAALLRERAAQLLDRSLASYLERLPYEKVASLKRFVIDRTVTALQGEKARSTSAGLLRYGFARIKDRSFESLARSLLPADGIERGLSWLSSQFRASLTSQESMAWLDQRSEAICEEWLFHRPLGRLGGRLPTDLREELHGALYGQLVEVLKKEVPPLVDSLDVARVVREKVDRLDVLEVEGLLMAIMREQFKYINLFGALLGALIGLVNLALIGLH